MIYVKNDQTESVLYRLYTYIMYILGVKLEWIKKSCTSPLSPTFFFGNIVSFHTIST